MVIGVVFTNLANELGHHLVYIYISFITLYIYIHIQLINMIDMINNKSYKHGTLYNRIYITVWMGYTNGKWYMITYEVYKSGKYDYIRMGK